MSYVRVMCTCHMQCHLWVSYVSVTLCKCHIPMPCFKNHVKTQQKNPPPPQRHVSGTEPKGSTTQREPWTYVLTGKKSGHLISEGLPMLMFCCTIVHFWPSGSLSGSSDFQILAFGVDHSINSGQAQLDKHNSDFQSAALAQDLSSDFWLDVP